MPDYLTDRRRRAFLHPELQAELDFGIEQSKGTTPEDLLENFNIFIQKKEEWEQANQQILAKRQEAVQQPFPAHHAGAVPNSALDVSKARPVASHPNWIGDKVNPGPKIQYLPVIVTPATKVREGAIPHLDTVSLWPLAEFRAWAQSALTKIREVRRTFSEPGDLAWRAAAATAFETARLDAPGLFSWLRGQSAKTSLTPIR